MNDLFSGMDGFMNPPSNPSTPSQQPSGNGGLFDSLPHQYNAPQSPKMAPAGNQYGAGLLDGMVANVGSNAARNSPVVKGQHEHRLDIRRMLFIETPGYLDNHHRSFNLLPDHNVMHRLEESTLRGANLESITLAPYAGMIVQPSATPTHKPLEISGGWRNRRLRFMLTIAHRNTLSGGEKLQYVFGYCEFMDYSNFRTGKIALPNEMKMTFNNTVTLAVNNNPNGSSNTRISDNSQYLIGEYDKDALVTDRYQNTMRPKDVLTHLHAIEAGHHNAANVSDTRQSFAYSAVVKNNRSNNLASEYLSRTLKAIDHGVASNAGVDQGAILRRGAGFAAEPLIREDAFMATLEQTTSITELGYVTWQDLCRLSANDLDGMAELRTFGNVTKQANAMRQGIISTGQSTMHNYGVFDGAANPWTSQTRGAVIASTISQQLPGLLVNNGICQLQFRSTNQTHNRSFVTSIIPETVLSLMAGGTPISLMNKFINEMENLILLPTTFNHEVDIVLDVFISTECDARIFISVAGGPMEYYVGTMFCDHVLSPNWTDNSNALENMAIGMQQVYTTIRRNSEDFQF